MRRPLTIVLEFGLCGFGASGGALPIMRMGIVTLAWWRGSLLEELKRNQEALAKAARDLAGTRAGQKVAGAGA